MSDHNDGHRTYLYRLLNARPYTMREAEERLIRRGMGEDDAVALVQEFSELGLLDDGVYARLFAEGHDNWGNDRIRYELRRRGVPEQVIAEALTTDGDDEHDKALPLAQSWREQGVEWRKIEGRLLRRGFSYKTIAALEKELSN